MAQMILADDPDLTDERNRTLNYKLKKLFSNKINWGMIS